MKDRKIEEIEKLDRIQLRLIKMRSGLYDSINTLTELIVLTELMKRDQKSKNEKGMPNM